MEQSHLDQIKAGLEALLFVSDRPVTLDQLKHIFVGFTVTDLQQLMEGLRDEYQKRNGGMVIVEIAGGYQMLSNQQCASYIRSFYKSTHKEKLSRPALETLAIIAYKQPVSRGDVESIRDVNSDGVVAHLLNKGLIKIAGHKEVPGRPFLYGTTKEFLEYFGLKSIDDLPKLEEFPSSSSTQQPTPTEEIAQAALSQESSGQSRLNAVIEASESLAGREFLNERGKNLTPSS